MESNSSHNQAAIDPDAQKAKSSFLVIVLLMVLTMVVMSILNLILNIQLQRLARTTTKHSQTIEEKAQSLGEQLRTIEQSIEKWRANNP